MLDFGAMTTKRINELVNIGARSRIDDKTFLEKELKRFLANPKRRAMIDGDLYYTYSQDIDHKRREVIGENGQLEEDRKLPNNRITDNRYADMVDQKVNYLLSKPLTFKCDNTQYEDALKNVFDKGFMRTLKNIGKDSYNGGIGWLYPYYDENGQFKFKKFHPWEVLPFWKDEEHTELDFAVRIYDELGYKGIEEVVYTFVEVYDTNGIHRFEYDRSACTLTPDYQTYYFELPTDGEIIPYNWNRVPLIAFKANSHELPLIRRCKSLQDGINYILSSFADGMEENASGNTILVIKNYDGENLGKFRHNLAQYKAIKVRTVDGADGGVDSLQIEVNCENYKAILTELRKALVCNCRGYDAEDLKSNGSPNEMTIKSVYSGIDLDANEMETEYQAAFEDLLWFVNQHLINTGVGDFSNEHVEIIFNRDMMVNESQIITDLNASSGILSQRTLVANHPYVSDVDAEMKQLEEEKQANIETYGFPFGDVDGGKEPEDGVDE